MNWLSRLEDYIFYAVTSVVAATAGGVWWLIRTVFTQKQVLEIVQQDLRNRDKLREEDRERMTKVEQGVERIEGLLMERSK